MQNTWLNYKDSRSRAQFKVKGFTLEFISDCLLAPGDCSCRSTAILLLLILANCVRAMKVVEKTKCQFLQMVQYSNMLQLTLRTDVLFEIFELRVRLASLHQFKPSSKIFY